MGSLRHDEISLSLSARRPTDGASGENICRASRGAPSCLCWAMWVAARACSTMLCLSRAPKRSRAFSWLATMVSAVPASSRMAISQVLLTADLLPRPTARALYLAYAPTKAVLQLFQLLWTLISLPKPEVVLLQTPPAVPTPAAAWLVRFLRGGAVIIDWHNLGFSMLEHTLKRATHPFVRLSRAYESRLSRRLDGHLCVTAAMAAWLQAEWGLEARVLHDRLEFFRRLSAAESHDLFREAGATIRRCRRGCALAARRREGEPVGGGGTPWTTASGELRPEGRPALLVSSTSWTADEDFGLLLDALAALDSCLCAEAGRADDCGRLAGPSVVAVITGKGPLKAHYENRMRALPLRRVAVCTMWLEPADYPRLLGAADLGVCLHTSTSGLDLPMKVLDMYGCGLPVCAVGFACLHELLTHGRNGLVFRTKDELASQLHSLLSPTDAAAKKLAQLRAGVAEVEASRPRWAENWSVSAGPLLLCEGSHCARRRPGGMPTLLVLLLTTLGATLLSLLIGRYRLRES